MRATLRPRRAALAACATLAVSALPSACGAGSDAGAANVTHTIVAFSQATGSGACAYLTTDALEAVYLGGVHEPGASRARAMAACHARSASFTGAPAVVSHIWFPAPHEAKAYAHRPGSSKSYTVTLRQNGGVWRINKIAH